MSEYISPVYDIKRIPIDKIQANAYNPNSVAPPEMKLLYQSIKEDGYTMPIVCYYLDDIDKYEIVDGFHRYSIMLKHKDIFEREGGCLPVSVIDKPIESRMASTIRHNRARGSHSIELMTNIVTELVDSGMGYTMNVLLSDAKTGELKGIRVFALNNAVSKNLYKFIEHQSEKNYSQRECDQALGYIYSRYSTNNLLNLAIASGKEN